MWEPLPVVLALVGAMVVISALTSVRTHFSLLLSGAKLEGVMESRQGLLCVRFYAVKQGSLTEVSLDIRLARLAVFRIDYPTVRLVRRGKRPVIRVHEEVELGGTGSASPVTKADKEYDSEALLRAVREFRFLARSVAPQLRRLASRVTVRDVVLEVDESTGSPDSTALAFGLLWGVLGYAQAGLSRATRLVAPPVLRVTPVYGAAGFQVEASADSSVRAFHVTVFVLRSLRTLSAFVRRHLHLARRLRRFSGRFRPHRTASAS